MTSSLLFGWVVVINPSQSAGVLLSASTVNVLALKAELLNEHGKKLFHAILWELTSNVISDVEEH